MKVRLSASCISLHIHTDQYQLNSIDNMKKDGKFMVGDDIPEGQGSVTSLLAECFDIAYDLRNEAEERQEAAELAESTENE